MAITSVRRSNLRMKYLTELMRPNCISAATTTLELVVNDWIFLSDAPIRNATTSGTRSLNTIPHLILASMSISLQM